MNDTSIEHKKAALDCMLLDAALAKCQATYWRTYPSCDEAFREARAERCLDRHNVLMQQYEQARREFMNTHSARAVLSRVPGQLRRMLARLSCGRIAMRLTGANARSPETGDTP